MNRKQKRDYYKSFKGQGGPARAIRKAAFGTFGMGLKCHFDSTGKGI